MLDEKVEITGDNDAVKSTIVEHRNEKIDKLFIYFHIHTPQIKSHWSSFCIDKNNNSYLLAFSSFFY